MARDRNPERPMNDDARSRDPWTARLSDYIDDELAQSERSALEAHLETCAECRATVADLRRVVTLAAGLDKSVVPGRDLWPAISARLHDPRRPLRVPFLAGWLRPRFAAAVALVGLLGCGAVLWLAHPGFQPVRQTSVRPASPATMHDVDPEYDKTVANLQREAEKRLTMDRRLVDVLNENLATLDAAIATYREALAAEPGDTELRDRLTAARQTKLDMLQQAVALAAEGSE
jgi:hypothetical protein